jgi:hypothetical protein
VLGSVHRTLPSECKTAVENAHRNRAWISTYKPGYTGDSCDISENPTIAVTRDAMDVLDHKTNCLTCLQYASKNQYDSCVCDSGWGGNDCEVSSIFGRICHAKCKDCHSPSRLNESNLQRAGTSMTLAPVLVMTRGSEMNVRSVQRSWRTTTSNIRGACRRSGPKEYDCFACINHASKTVEGACISYK